MSSHRKYLSPWGLNKSTMFDVPNSFGELHDRRWLRRKNHYYQNPTQYKKHLEEEVNQNWDLAKKGGINEEISENEALRKKRVEKKKEEELKRREEEERKRKEEARIAEEKRLASIPNFPKVWDLSYVRDPPQKIFLKKSDDTLDWNSLTLRPMWMKKLFYDKVLRKSG